MCKRPAPDILYRTAIRDDDLRGPGGMTEPVLAEVMVGDLVIVGSVSISQRSLMDDRRWDDNPPEPDYGAPRPPNAYADDSIVFGGLRRGRDDACPYSVPGLPPFPSADQPAGLPTHACPARKLMTGAITGIVGALLNAGEIQAMPAGLVIGLSAAAR
jgi:hypothetical protein